MSEVKYINRFAVMQTLQRHLRRSWGFPETAILSCRPVRTERKGFQVDPTPEQARSGLGEHKRISAKVALSTGPPSRTHATLSKERLTVRPRPALLRSSSNFPSPFGREK